MTPQRVRTWVPIFHLYQPAGWPAATIRRVARESYRPFFRILAARPGVHVTLNVTASLTEQLDALGLTDVLHLLRTCAERGQVEYLTTAKYHALLPFIPAAEGRRQIALNTETNRRILGPSYQPRGLFPPELCYSTAVVPLARDAHLAYVVLDEIAYDGRIGDVRFDTRYTVPSPTLPIAFRHRPMSDLFFTDVLERPEDFLRALESDARCADGVVTAMDGELLGHHHPGLDAVFAGILDSGRVRTETVSTFLSHRTRTEYVEPRPSSWASRESEIAAGIPYALWWHPKNDLHGRQWELLTLVQRAVTMATDDPTYARARDLLDQHQNSDPQWWASAMPWWDVAIVTDGARRLFDTLAALSKPLPADVRRARLLAEEIATLARRWQESGKAAEIRRQYLRGESSGRYFGGVRLPKTPRA